MRNKSVRQDGFTIIELMIATAILSTILLMSTVIIVNIGNLYYKGINQARVQDNVRSVSDEISQQLKLGDSLTVSAMPGPNGERAYCIGAVRYTYVIGVQINHPAPGSGAPVFQHVLWRDDNPVPATCDVFGTHPVNLANSPASTGTNGAELIAPHSRLTNFQITGNSPYNVNVGVAYGDNDLLCNSSVGGSCTSGAAMPSLANYTTGTLLCKGQSSQQFCATARLNTSVIKRLP